MTCPNCGQDHGDTTACPSFGMTPQDLGFPDPGPPPRWEGVSSVTIRTADGVEMLVGLPRFLGLTGALLDEDVVWLPTEERVRQIVREELERRGPQHFTHQ